MRSRITILALVAMAMACGDDALSRTEPPPVPVSLTIWNSSQRPLEEVRVHSGTEYLNAGSILTAPLPDDDRTQVDIFSGQHVTVIRRNVDGGQRIAFTTAQGLSLPTSGYVLQVFQESFRLHEPEFHDGPSPDGGPNDGGDPSGGDDADGGDGDADTNTDGGGDVHGDAMGDS